MQNSFVPVPQGESNCNESGSRSIEEYSICILHHRDVRMAPLSTCTAAIQCSHTVREEKTHKSLCFLKPNLRIFFESFKLFTKYLCLLFL